MVTVRVPTDSLVVTILFRDVNILPPSIVYAKSSNVSLFAILPSLYIVIVRCIIPSLYDVSKPYGCLTVRVNVDKFSTTSALCSPTVISLFYVNETT